MKEKESAPLLEYRRHKLQEALPYFSECVLEQWVHRHFDCFMSDFWFLKSEKLDFKLESLSNEEIMEIGFEKDRSKEFDSLDNHFIKNKTWHKPIIILKNDNHKSHGLYKLLEGHRRLINLREYIVANIEGLPDKHYVWVVNTA